MKKISWEQFKDEEEEEEGLTPGLVLGQLSSMNPNVNEYKDFNFYVGHCNFYINTETVNFLCGVTGVESLDVLSPYRFRISVGKLFPAQPVLDTIEDQLTGEQDG